MFFSRCRYPLKYNYSLLHLVTLHLYQISLDHYLNLGKLPQHLLFCIGSNHFIIFFKKLIKSKFNFCLTLYLFLRVKIQHPLCNYSIILNFLKFLLFFHLPSALTQIPNLLLAFFMAMYLISFHVPTLKVTDYLSYFSHYCL